MDKITQASALRNRSPYCLYVKTYDEKPNYQIRSILLCKNNTYALFYAITAAAALRLYLICRVGL
jgi:hypothetical protein